MFRILTTFVIATLLSNGFTTYAQTSSTQEIKFKRQIVERGANQKVKVKLKSNEMLQGTIAEIRNDSFTLQLVDAAGQINNRDIAYSELSNVSKADGKSLGTTFKHGMVKGAGFYLGMLAVSALALVIAAAVID